MWVSPASKPLYSATLFVATPMTSKSSATIFPFSVTTAPYPAGPGFPREPPSAVSLNERAVS